MKSLARIPKSITFLFWMTILVGIVYPLFITAVAQICFPARANGSLLVIDGKVRGSTLLAQKFVSDKFFHARPSATDYTYIGSGASNLAATNYALQSRIAQTKGPIETYRAGTKAGQLVGPDIENWFQRDIYQGKPHIVAQWANMHNSEDAQAWVTSDPTHGASVDAWAKAHPAIVDQFVKDNPGTPKPQASDLSAVFFSSFSEEHPGAFPSVATSTDAKGKAVTTIEPVTTGSDIQSYFFDMWRQDHPSDALASIPDDYVTTSGSGLDPDISLETALSQVDRVASARSFNAAQKAALIEKIKNAASASTTLIGPPRVNVVQLNARLEKDPTLSGK
jgi:K+-transporting ATPase ATPase C chain